MATGFTTITRAVNIRPEQVLEYFSIPIDDNNKAVCPFHAEDNASLQVNKEYVYCFGCKKAFDTFSLAQELLRKTTNEEWSFTRVWYWFQTTSLPERSEREYRKIEYKGAVPDNLIQYWRNSIEENQLTTTLCSERLLTPETIQKFSLGYRADKDAWVIPYLRHGSADIVQFRSRKTNDSSAKYWGLAGHNRGSIMNWDLLDTPQDYVVILMGAYDAILASQDGLLAVGINGSFPFRAEEKERVQEIFAAQKTIFVVPDNTESEYASAEKLAEWLNGDVRRFPTALPKDCDYIDYRKLGYTAEDFKLCVLGITPYVQPDTELIEDLKTLLLRGDQYRLAPVHWKQRAQNVIVRDVAVALANSLKSHDLKRHLYNARNEQELRQVFEKSYNLLGGW